MNPTTAIKTMLWLLLVVVLFHISILVKITPSEITWGGRLKSDNEMYVFETVSIMINLFLGLLLLIKGNYFTQILSPKIVNIVLWVFLVLFVLNTIGNLFAQTMFEKFFAILTAASGFLIWVVLNKDKKSANGFV